MDVLSLHEDVSGVVKGAILAQSSRGKQRCFRPLRAVCSDRSCNEQKTRNLAASLHMRSDATDGSATVQASDYETAEMQSNRMRG